MEIPFFDYPKLYSDHKQKLLEIFDATASKGAFIMQSDLQDFENNLSKYVDAYVLGVGNATDALELLFHAKDIKENDEIIFCSHTMVATASAIKFAGAVPIPCEAGKDHLIDVEKIEGLITNKTRAIMPTQLNGRVSNMSAINEIAEKYNLEIFEDSAQALGARFKGQHAGTFGAGGCISFYPAKILGCLGDGGAVVCNDYETYEKVKLLRDHGRSESGEVEFWGFNSRLDNIQAAFLNYYFEFYEETISRRRNIAEIYFENLREVSELHLPPSMEDSDNFDVFQNYEIQAKNRDELKEYLRENGVGTLIQWGGKAVHQFKNLGFNQVLPYTEELFTKLLMLPINMTISDEEVVYVSKKIKEFYS